MRLKPAEGGRDPRTATPSDRTTGGAANGREPGVPAHSERDHAIAREFDRRAADRRVAVGDGARHSVLPAGEPQGDDAAQLRALRRAEERLQALLQNSADFVLVWDGNGTITYVTPSVRRFLGEVLDEREPGEEFGVTHPDDRQRVLDVIARVSEEPGRVERFRFRGLRTDGEYRWLDTTVSNLVEDRSVGGIVLNALDVTGQVEAERALEETNDALRRSNATMTAIVKNSPLAMYAVDLEDKVVLWNPACEQLLGVAASAALGAPLSVVPRHQRDKYEWLRRQLAGGRIIDRMETRTRLLDGREIDIAFSAAPLLGEHGEHVGMLVLCADIGEKKATEEALLRSEATFRGVVQHASDLILLLGPDRRIRYASPAVHEVLGYTQELVLGRDPLELVDPDDFDNLAELFGTHAATGASPKAEVRVRHADGSWRVVEVIGHDLLDDPSIESFVVTARDITSRREAEAALRQREQRFRALIQNLSDVITVVDEHGNVVYSSPAALELFGRGDDLEELHQLVNVHPDDRDAVVDGFTAHLAAPAGEREPVQFRLQRADGLWRHVESVAVNLLDDPAVGGIVVTTRDITDRREAESRVAASEARYRAIVEDQTEFITRADVEGRYTFVNDAFARAVGREPEELLGLDVFELFDAAEINEVADVIADHGGAGSVTTEHRTVLNDGEVRWAHWMTRPVYDDRGQLTEYQSIGRDVTEAKRAKERLAAQAKILELVAKGRPLSETLEALCSAVEEHVPGARTAVHLVDEAGTGLRCAAAPSMSERFPRIVGTITFGPGTGASGTAVARGEEVIIDDVASHPGLDAHRQGCLANGIAAMWAIPIRSASGGAVLGALTVYHPYARGPRDDERQLLDQIVHLAAIAVDRKAFESRLAHQAQHDPLTGLPNRALFLEFLMHALARSRRRKSAVAVLFLDLDRFKYVNDSFGHDTGDELLTSLALRLQTVVRPGDTIARFGGDEFVVLCEDLSPELARDQAIEVAERLVEVVESPFSCQGQAHFLSTSVGIAYSTGGDARPEALLRDADAAMYRAKERGKGRWEVFDEAMRLSVVQRVETENALHRAIERNEFEVFYQPVVSLHDRSFVGAEALVRWRHPERGLVLPTEFITLAEETGLVVPLGRWVLEEACRQADVWRRARGDDAFTISVNMSARQLARSELVAEVADALRQSAVPPAMICLEITESVLMDDVEVSLAAIRALKSLGIRLSIDDFGTGYSSLGYLKRLPVDAVKVDRSFVDGLGTDPEDSAIVAAVVNLGHTLGLTVVAEGVETNVQLAELVALGCDEAQGFLFSAAVPPAEFDELIRSVAL
jgi:diguanylate cyclase (GGDEF)-like protein/PAS domain S-box-containing protein